MIDMTSLELDRLRQVKLEGRFRRLRSAGPVSSARVVMDGKELVNFASNDYLGISHHPRLIENALSFTKRYGVGAGASRLLSGNLDCYERLEQKIAQLKGTETALIFNSGYQANQSVISCLAEKSSHFFFDRLCHRSLIEGVLSSRCRFERFKHNDPMDLRSRMIRHVATTSAKSQNSLETPGAKWIVSETVFGMDGDTAPVQELSELAASFGVRLYLDEAHATGLFGDHGTGLAAKRSDIQIIMGTFSKALGGFGAYVACSHEMRNYLINFCGGLIYSTALPPAALGAIEAALELLPHLDAERYSLFKLASYLRDRLNRLGYDTGDSTTHIVPIIVREDQRALELSTLLQEAGFYAPAIRTPTVPEGSARLRISLTAMHSQADIDALIAALVSCQKSLVSI